MPGEPKKRLVVKDVAAQLLCGHSVAYRLMSSGEIESALIAQRWSCTQEAVDAYIERQTQRANAPQRRRRARRAS